MIAITVGRLDDFMMLLRKCVNNEIYYTLFEEEGKVIAIGLAFIGKIDGGPGLYQIKIPVEMTRSEAVKEIRLIAKHNDLTAIEGNIKEVVMSVPSA
ncbi:MAG: hypothetical protein QXL15_00615 [Candidatus Korarchaeota archaeon]